MPYSSKDLVETWGQLSTGDVGGVGYSYENTVEQMITTADNMIDEYCRQPFGFFESGGVSIDNEMHSGVEIGYYGLYPSFGLYTVKRRPFLRLEYTPVLSVTKLEDNTSGSTWTTRTEGRDSDYLVESDGVRYFRSVPKYDYGNVRVSYVTGYALIPGVVEECSARLAAGLVQRLKDNRERGGGSVAGYTVNAPDVSKPVFNDELKMLVKRFRRRVPVKVVV